MNELIDNARNANLAEYFQRNGYSTKRHGNELYIEEFSGLCVNTKSNTWYSHYDGFGGHNAVDCLTKVLQKPFKQAVEELSGNSFFISERKNIQYKTAEKKELKLPERAENMKRVYAYLVKTRKIPANVINELVKKGLLHQDIKGNCVFLHKNENGETVGAELQGTTTEVRFKGICAGTKDSVFALPMCKNPTKVYAFESAIDMLSFYSFCDKSKVQDAVFVSMAGLKPSRLKNFQSKGMQIFACVDNDEAGRKFCADNGFKHLNDRLAKENVKDWNDLLQKNCTVTLEIKSPANKLKK